MAADGNAEMETTTSGSLSDSDSASAVRDAETQVTSLSKLRPWTEIEKLAAVDNVLDYLEQESGRSIPRREDIKINVKDYIAAKKQGRTPEKCLINDAIYGPIELSPLMYQIINTPEFHRLKNIHQLGAAHYVYPGANHTRFDHSIGVCYLAKEFAELLRKQFLKDYCDTKPLEPKEQVYIFKQEEVLCAQIAGLCHDLGHGPLSHMFDHLVVSEILSDKEKEGREHEHEVLSVAIFKRIMENPKVLAEFVDEELSGEHVQLIGEMIRPKEIRRPQEYSKYKRSFLYEIVANKSTGIDVDKWDYYARDCHYLGLEHDFQMRRCMFLGRVVMTPDDDNGEGRLRIAFRDKELDNLYGMFRTRALLHQKAYQHKTIKAVEKMIADAFLYVRDLRIICVSKEPKSIKEAVEYAYKEKPNQDLKWYLALTDSIIGTIQYYADTKEQSDDLDSAQKLLKRVEERDLYSCTTNIRIPEIKLEMDCSECSKRICLDQEVRLNLQVIEKLSGKSEKSEKKKFLNDVWKKFRGENPSELKEELWLEVVKIRLSSEKGSPDPVKRVVFYKKSKDSTGNIVVCSLSEITKKISKVVVPQAFIEHELRVYDKREAKDRDVGQDREKLSDATEKTLEEWRKK